MISMSDNRFWSAGMMQIARETRIANATDARRGEAAPSVPAGLKGKASAEEVERWTTYLPAKPPGRT